MPYVLPLIYGSNSALAQQNPILGHFSLFETNGKVSLSWTIVKGSTCDGITIYRSTDSLHYTQIGEIAGVCGSISEPLNYSFTDEQPVKNGINCYKLDLGNYGESQVLSVEIIDIESNGYQVRPNPMNNEGKIYFDNDRKEIHHLVIYQLNGSIITDISSEQDYFDIDLSNFPSGLHIFTISTLSGNIKATGKVIISR